MALDATIGGATSNSFVTLDEANEYLAFRPFSAAWGDLDPDVQEAALAQACRDINATYIWTGLPVDGVQALAWPRNGMFTRNGYPIDPTTMPQELKDAQCELARTIALGSEDLTATSSQEISGIAEIKAGPVAVRFREPLQDSATTVALLDAALRMKGPEYAYLNTRLIPAYVTNMLVPSWYQHAPSLRGNILFKAVR